VLALGGLCNRLIVFIRREPGNCRFTILELADLQHIAYGQFWKLERFLTVVLLSMAFDLRYNTRRKATKSVFSDCAN
jgi:hypothetical protein